MHEIIASEVTSTGGAPTSYRIVHEGGECVIGFEHGTPVNPGGPGVHIEDLLKVCLDRLKVFQSGDFQCVENAVAIGSIQSAIGALESRSRSREERGVKGFPVQ